MCSAAVQAQMCWCKTITAVQRVRVSLGSWLCQQVAAVEATRRLSTGSARRQSLTDFLQRRSLTDARSSIFHTFGRRQSRAGAPLAPEVTVLMPYAEGAACVVLYRITLLLN